MNVLEITHIVRAKWNKQGKYDWHTIGFFTAEDDAQLYMTAVIEDPDCLIKAVDIEVKEVDIVLNCVVTND